MDSEGIATGGRMAIIVVVVMKSGDVEAFLLQRLHFC